MKAIEILIAEYLFCGTVEKAIECGKENEFDSCLEKANYIFQMVHLDRLQKRLLTLDRLDHLQKRLLTLENNNNSYFKNKWRL